MGRLESLKQKLANRETILSTTISNIAWSGLAQKIAGYPFDFIVFDLEHGTLSTESVEESLRICRLTDLPSIVRVSDCTPSNISKILDMGADGVLLPRVETLEQVETAIRAGKYYPRGRKGCGGFSNFRKEDEALVDKYNDNRIIFIQMESQEGLNVLPEILNRYKSEVDGVIIGPYDTSIMLGTPLNIKSEKMLDFINRVFSTCKDNNTSSGIFVDNSSMIQGYYDMGANIFWVGTEISMFCESLDRVCKAHENIMK